MGKTTSHKAQSAMEYLMTYGWAILIIAIVLAALFSLGIFSSGSLIGTTCIANSGFLCSSPIAYGTTFTATIGEATGVPWTNVVLCFVPDGVSEPSSCSGYPSVAAGNIRSGAPKTYSFTILSSSSTTSGYIWAQYDEASYSGLMSELATVTMKGLKPSSATTSISSTSTSTKTTTSTSTTTLTTTSTTSTSTTTTILPSGVTDYANVVITNSQSTATPAPFQQEVQIPESDYSNYISYNGVSANFEFFASGGSVIPAWIESNSSGTLTVWLNLANGIPASNSITVYLGFAPKTTNLLSSSGTTGIGEAPQLSPSYAEYDDGASVFNFYSDFKGTSLNTNKWTSGTSNGGTITVNNGITLTYSSSSAGGAWIVGNQYFSQSSNVVFEALFNMYGTSNFGDTRGRMYWWEQGQTSIADGNGGAIAEILGEGDYGYYTSSSIGANIANIMLPYETILGTLPAPSSSSDYNVMSQQILASGTFIFNTLNYPSYSLIASKTVTGSTTNSFSPLIQASDDGSSGNTVTFNVQWVRVRAYPPSGVMPSVSLGSVIIG
ncbi:MAG: hypothetical protein BK997_04995 [Candidatus Micrarchaeum sp. ARMAN-1]|jgi:hypothetical protein|nr:MAG: hypothetical protein BK997_04995 [Candidatus Micrarchaeum sp. ARMAN-1]OJT94211.1 MAG: hypothetical protein JJ59_04575 [Candidatus Micrarchaeum sp. AZ1]OWP53400.1 MAG: hypothetical protein B2I19_02990 [Thermoplasmatales archaeon ARMAN]